MSNFALGFLVGGLFIVVLGVLADATFGTALWDTLSNVLALAGVLFTAWLTLTGVLATIDNQTSIDEKNRLAKLDAAKSSLPLALFHMSKVCESRIQHEICGTRAPETSESLAPDITLRTFEMCIELTTGRPQAVLKEIAMLYQIMLSRGVTNSPLPIDDPELDKTAKRTRAHSIVDWVSFQTIIESVFDFARNRSDDVDRDGVAGRFEVKLEWLSNEGSMLTNDTAIAQTFEFYKANPSRTFNDPNWINRRLDG